MLRVKRRLDKFINLHETTSLSSIEIYSNLIKSQTRGISASPAGSSGRGKGSVGKSEIVRCGAPFARDHAGGRGRG